MPIDPAKISADAHVGIGWRHPHYAKVLECRPAVDFLEVHSENFFAMGGATLSVLEQGRAHYPVSLHGVGLSLGSAVGLDAWHLDQLARLVERIDPVRVSDHASFARGVFQGAVTHASDLLPIPFSTRALDVLCANVQRTQDRLQRSILVENLSAYIHLQPPDGEAAIPEPAFLTNLAKRTGCQLLVDVNNIYVNALNARLAGSAADPVQSCKSWLDDIPAGAVGEIHLAGHCHVADTHGEIVIDDHGSPVCDAVWDIYRHAVVRFGPVPTLMEWDTDIPELDVLLREAQHARNTANSVLQRGAV